MDRRNMMLGLPAWPPRCCKAGAGRHGGAGRRRAAHRPQGKSSRCGPARRRAGAALRLPPIRVTNHEPPYLTPADRAIDQVGNPGDECVPPRQARRLGHDPGAGRRLFAARCWISKAWMWRAISMPPASPVFVLRYRLPGEGWQNRSDVPLQDAQRAMRLVRANAANYGIDPARIGFMGFSAGGHVACSIATRFAAKVYDAGGCRRQRRCPAQLLGADVSGGDHGRGPPPGLARQAAGARSVAGADRRLFLREACAGRCAADLAGAGRRRQAVPPHAQCGAPIMRRCCAAKVPAEMHMFEVGGHGFGIARTRGKPDAAWPGLLLRWGASHGFFKRRGLIVFARSFMQLGAPAPPHKVQRLAQHADAGIGARRVFAQMAAEQPRAGPAIVKPQHRLDQRMQPRALRAAGVRHVRHRSRSPHPGRPARRRRSAHPLPPAGPDSDRRRGPASRHRHGARCSSRLFQILDAAIDQDGEVGPLAA